MVNPAGNSPFEYLKNLGEPPKAKTEQNDELKPSDQSISDKCKLAFGKEFGVANKGGEVKANVFRGSLRDAVKNSGLELTPREYKLLQSDSMASSLARRKAGMPFDDMITLNINNNDANLIGVDKQTKVAFDIYTKLLDKLIQQKTAT